jgi:hypothetical protein
VRVVIGSWARSPFGAFADAMVEHADGRRVLIAPNDAVAALVGDVYAFDEVVVADVHVERTPDRLRFAGAALSADVGIGRRDGLGRVLRCVPRPIARSVTWATIIDPFARVAMRGVRTRGRTPGGRETYGATDRHRLTAVEATLDGAALGPLADVHPPVHFGFSSAPRRPSIVATTTSIRRT